MKKTLAVFLLLAAAAAALLTCSASRIEQTQDQVLYTETTLAGDPAQAEGLRADLRLHSDYHLFWQVEMAAGAAPRTQAAFSYSPRQGRDYTAEQGGIERHYGVHFVASYASFGASSVTGLDERELDPVAQAVASRTAAGEVHSETLVAADYWTNYPLAAHISCPYDAYFHPGQLLRTEADPEAADALLSSYLAPLFPLPVAPAATITVTIEKDASGAVISQHQQLPPEQELWLTSQNAVTPAGYCFALTASYPDGSLLDHSRFPQGYGVYILPSYNGEKGLTLDLEQIHLVFPLDIEEEAILALASSLDGSRLFLATAGEDFCLLRILDAVTYAEIEAIPLALDCQSSTDLRLYPGADYLLAVLNDRDFILLAKDESGGYQQAISNSFPSDQSWFTRLLTPALAWDGRRLAVSAQPGTVDSDGFTIAVFDRQGLLYLGEYTANLNQQPSSYQDCRRVPNSLALSWQP